jgi:hypothetical protein
LRIRSIANLMPKHLPSCSLIEGVATRRANIRFVRTSHIATTFARSVQDACYASGTPGPHSRRSYRAMSRGWRLDRLEDKLGRQYECDVLGQAHCVAGRLCRCPRRRRCGGCSCTNADDRLPRPPIGRVGGGDGIVEGSHRSLIRHHNRRSLTKLSQKPPVTSTLVRRRP